jgi:hypothetical protein
MVIPNEKNVLANLRCVSESQHLVCVALMMTSALLHDTDLGFRAVYMLAMVNTSSLQIAGETN